MNTCSIRDAAIAFAFLTSGAPVIAGDHLEPVVAQGEDFYRDLLRRVFAKSHASHFAIQAIIIPSFTAERAVAIDQVENSYYLVVLKPRQHLWRYALAEQIRSGLAIKVSEKPDEAATLNAKEIADLLRGLPNDPMKVPLDRCEGELDEGTGQLLMAAWKKGLEGTRGDTAQEAEDQEIIVDGTSYIFWRRAGAVEQEGQVYSPSSGTTSSLAELANSLVKDCDSALDDAKLRKLARQVVKSAN